MIPKLSMNEFDSQAKINKTLHKYVMRISELLDLIYSNLCKFDGVLIRPV